MTILIVNVFILLTIVEFTECFWGGHGGYNGGYGGNFNAGYNQHGHGYGPDICAAARQRQQQASGGGRRGSIQQPNSYQGYPSDFGGFNRPAYYQNPSFNVGNSQQEVPTFNNLFRPLSNNPIGQRTTFNVTTTTTRRPTTTTPPMPPTYTCYPPELRDSTVYNQKCIQPLSNEHSSCSESYFPVGATSITTCKAPHFYSKRGDMLLEICRKGQWQSEGTPLICKPMRMEASPEKNNQKQNFSKGHPQMVRDPVANYVQNTQYPDEMPIAYPDTKLPEYVEDYPIYLTTTTKPTTTTEKPTTSTTALPETTAKPYHLPHNVDWRNYGGSQTPEASHHQKPSHPLSFYGKTPSESHYPPANHSDYNAATNSHNPSPHDKQQTDYSHQPSDPEKCPPLRTKSGAILECLSKSPSKSKGNSSSSGYIVSVSDCQDQQPHGTEATFKCQMYYEPVSGLVTQYRKCKDTSQWTGSDDGFSCKLECGKSNPGGRLPLITFGETTILGNWPWHAALFIKDRGDIQNACGGSLISQRAVVSAAHCVNLYLSSMHRDYNDIRVDLGRYHREKDDPYVQKFQVEKIITHPAYNPFIFESDIAIIILKEPARIGYHVRPICFPKSQNAAFDELQLADGSVATVVGWGVDETGETPDELRSAKLRVIGYKECIESFEETDTGALLAKSTTFCAGNKNGTNVCRGDSGSGAYFAVKASTGETRWFLQGLVSLGINVAENNKKCDPEAVSIFTRISPYSDWIVRVLSENDAL